MPCEESLFLQQHHVGTQTYLVSIFTTCGCVAARMESGAQSVFLAGKYMHKDKNVCFIRMIFYCPVIWSSVFPSPCDLWPLPWTLKSSSLCSSCGHCHCHTGLLPLIVCTRTPEITSIQVTSPMVKTKHTVTMHTHTHTCVHAMPKLKHCAWHHWENRNVAYANEIKSS